MDSIKVDRLDADFSNSLQASQLVPHKSAVSKRFGRSSAIIHSLNAKNSQALIGRSDLVFELQHERIDKLELKRKS